MKILKQDNDAVKLSIVVLIALGVFAVYGDVIGHDFLHYDDNDYIFDNPVVLQGLTWQGIAWAFTSTAKSNWHPITWLSHMLDVQIFGIAPAGHHLVNVGLHAANSVFLLYLLCRLTGSLWRSAIVAALFAVHPLHVESVAWAAERKDVLSTFFFLWTLYLYAGYTRRPTPNRYGLMLAIFALGLMAKPMLVILPPVMLLLDFWPLCRLPFSPLREIDNSHPARPSLRSVLLEKLPFVILAALSCCITIYAQREGNALSSLMNCSLAARTENALVSYVSYLGKTFWPERLAVFYPYRTGLPLWQPAASAAVLLAVSYAAIRQRHKRPYLLTGWLWYLGTLVPVIGLVQVGLQAMADRYTYIPLIGIFIIAVWGTHDITSRFRFRHALCAGVVSLVLLACIVTSRRQIAYWKDLKTLFTHALSVTPENPIARFNLGLALGLEGNFHDAAENFRTALSLPPPIPKTHYNLGLSLHRLGRLDEAIQQYRAELKDNPEYEDCRINLGIAINERDALVTQGGLYRR